MIARIACGVNCHRLNDGPKQTALRADPDQVEMLCPLPALPWQGVLRGGHDGDAYDVFGGRERPKKTGILSRKIGLDFISRGS